MQNKPGDRLNYFYNIYAERKDVPKIGSRDR